MVGSPISQRDPDQTPPILDDPIQSGVISARAAAAALGVNEKTIRRAIARGELEAVKQDGSFRIAPDALARYRQSDRRQGPGLVDIDAATRNPPTLLPLPRVEPAPFDILPLPLTRFVGRERDVATLAALLWREGVRLVTLTGPGGVGKTRLALQVVDAIAADFAGGAAFISLAPVRAPELVLPTIVQALGLRDLEGRPPHERLVTALHNREALLILDNFEQIADAGPAVVEILVACRRLTILVTSRAPLHLSGEHLFPVPPLSLPNRGLDSLVPGLLDACEAVQLFVDRARSVSPDFALTPANAEDVAAICERTDGLPLAIELAAARARILSPADLLARMARRLPVLTGGPRDQPGRLRTMRDAIAWSYDLLAPEEQALFRRLAVFVGGFTLEAAEYVGGDGPAGLRGERGDGSEATPPKAKPSPPQMLDHLTTLVDESLVQKVVQADGEVRYSLLETVREFGLEVLVSRGEETATREVHVDWCIAFGERAGPELAGADHVAWFHRIEAEIGNIRAALAWLFERDDAQRALRLGNALGWFWQAAGNYAEGRALFTGLIAMAGVAEAPRALAQAMGTAGSLEQTLSDFESARRHLERALTLYRDLGDRLGIVASLRTLGSIALDRADLDEAEPLLLEVVALAAEAGARWEEASALNLLGVVAYSRGEYQAAVRRAEEAEARWRDQDDTGHVGLARACLARALLATGDHRLAADAARDVLRDLADAGDDLLICECFEVAAGLAHAAGDQVQAARLLGASDAVMRRVATVRWPGYQAAFDDLLRQTRSRLSPAAFASAWETGQALPLEQATAEAFVVLDRYSGERMLLTPTVPRPEALTPRQHEIVQLLVEGLSDKEIAAALGISRHTVSNHLRTIREKLAVSSRAAAVALALRDGLLERERPQT
jgi:predicted ATPase/DNA-binding CsgD family transcriptional regulator